jgi:hypothetical protein
MMRILLQQKESGHYLQNDGSWAREIASAQDFLSSTRAIEYCADHHIAGVQLVLKFEEHRYDIVLPMLMESVPTPGRARL